MYEIIKQILESGDFNLEEYTRKINILWVQRELDDSQRDELLTIAQEQVKPEAQEASIMTQLEALTLRVIALEEAQMRMQHELPETGGGVDVQIDTTPKEFVTPPSRAEAYHYGDFITWKGDIYVCTRKGKDVMNDPKVYPIGWEKITQDQYRQIKGGQLLEDVLNPKSDGEA